MTNPFFYTGRRVVVTGGSRGVGAALLELLAELDADHVTVVDISAPSGPHADFIETDLSDEDAVRAAVAKVDGPVHALFNNAGVADTLPQDTVFAVNYLALRTLTEGLLDRMPQGSAVVSTASTAGSTWKQRVKEIDELLALDISDSWTESAKWFAERAADLGQGPYNFTKEIVERYTLRLSRPAMHQSGVRVNAVCPGPIDTPLLKDFRESTSDKIIDWNIREMAGRAVAPSEVASALAFLGSPAAGYVNGINLDIDGGFFAAIATGQVDFSGRT